MDSSKLSQYILQLLPMQQTRANELSSQFEFVSIPKNEIILQENKISKETYFLESGIIRTFIIDNNGIEVTTSLFIGPCFANDFLSFFKQEPTSENFESLTECRIWKMSYNDVQKSFHNIPEFREFGRMMLVTNYSKLHNRMLGMIRDNAETRYLKLVNAYPELFQNIPLKIIASYLGITDTSLSRIRKEISSK